MSTTKEVAKTEEKWTEFVPFGAKDAIKLSVDMVRSLIAVPTKTNKVATANDCIRFIAMCKAKRLNPFEGDAFLIGFDSRDAPGGVKFNLITAHQAFLKRAEVHPEFDGMKSGVIVMREDKMVELEGDFHFDNDVVVGGWATVFFKNRSNPMIRRLRLSRFKKPFGVWNEDPGGMICKCAEADALRSSFPTMLGGLYVREEMSIDESPKMAEPIFGKNTLPEPIPVEAIGAPKSPVEQIAMLCKQDDVQERSLIDWLATIGMADDKATKLSELSDETHDALINQWEDFRDKLKEAMK